MTTALLFAQARAWRDQDPDTETREALTQCLDAAQRGERSALKTLQAQFSGRLKFGTAGLRGHLQAGPMGMNRLLVAQSAAGLARYLLKTHAKPSVIIGYDARKNSTQFALDTASIMQGMGVDAKLLPEQLPTPILAFALRALNVDAGVMVTASHNPPQDNGYKVYLGGENTGAQIVPPEDAEIAAHIQWIADHIAYDAIPKCDDFERLDTTIVDAYIKQTVAVVNSPICPLNYVYTAMHGVGTKTLLATLSQANLPLPHLVEAQCTPDPNFPTVAFPNPEEPGALDLAISLAQHQNAEFILANDPDADRLAVAIPTGSGWQRLHGNTIGLWLAWEIAKQTKAQNKTGVLACSLVSSPLLKKIADAYQLDFVETLTGFKWISRVPNLLFGYEEALGYLVDPDKVHDKDGISAAIAFLNLVLTLKNQHKTLTQYADEFVAAFGAAASGQVSIRVDSTAEIDVIMRRYRQSPAKQFADIAVTSVIDHLKTEWKDNILVFYLENDARIILRPSGTEPKLKIYIDAQARSIAEAQSIIDTLADSLRAQNSVA